MAHQCIEISDGARERDRKEEEVRLFSAVFNNRARCNGCKLKCKNFHLILRRNFTLRLFKHWNRFVGCRDTQSPTGHKPEQPALGDRVLTREVGLDYLQWSLPMSVMVYSKHRKKTS